MSLLAFLNRCTIGGGDPTSIFEEHVLLPSQLLPPPRDTAGRRLAHAVFAQAIRDLRGPHPRVRNPHRLRSESAAQRDAIRWFRSNHRAWPCDFLNICDALGLNAESVRRLIAARSVRSGGIERTEVAA